MDSHELPLTTLLFCLLQLIKLTAGFSLFTKFWESELYSQDSQDPELRDGTVYLCTLAGTLRRDPFGWVLSICSIVALGAWAQRLHTVYTRRQYSIYNGFTSLLGNFSAFRYLPPGKRCLFMAMLYAIRATSRSNSVSLSVGDLVSCVTLPRTTIV